MIQMIAWESFILSTRTDTIPHLRFIPTITKKPNTPFQSNSIALLMQKWFNIFCIFLLSQILTHQSTAQNLVVNGSFEDTSACLQNPPPSYPTCAGSCYTPPWFEPLFGTIDYYNYYYAIPCGGGGGYLSNYYSSYTLGYQLPFSGNGMMGMACMLYIPNYREYLQYPLSTTLISGHVYSVSFKVSLANYSRVAVDKIGMYFSADSMLELTDFQGVMPQILSPPGIPMIDTLNWMTINGTFTSNGTENFLTIGNFYPDSLSDSVTVIPEAYIPGTYRLSYYYVDDVSIFDTTVGLVESHDAEFEISPNPGNGVFRLTLPETDGIQQKRSISI
jgi:hypothetical protein